MRWDQRKMKQSMDMRGLLRSSTNSPPPPPAAAVALALFLLPVESADGHEGEGGLFLPQAADASPPAPAGWGGRMRLAAAAVGVVLARRPLMLPGLFFLGDLTTDRAGCVLLLGEGGRGVAWAGESFFFLFFLLLLMLGSSTTTSISTSVSLQARALRNSTEKRGPDDHDGEE